MKAGAQHARRQMRALVGATLLAAAYIVISTQAVSALDASSIFPSAWAADEKATGGGFLVGALVQAALVMLIAFAFNNPDMRNAVAASFAASTGKAWIIAALATVIHIGTALLLVLPAPERVGELSALNLLLSIIPAADGWSQEVMFRGYVLFRLARAGVPAMVQILTSGLLFAAIHIGYVGADFWDIVSPLVGTFMLGCFYAWAVRSGNGSLKPVIACHALIILVLQPWLALAH